MGFCVGREVLFPKLNELDVVKILLVCIGIDGDILMTPMDEVSSKMWAFRLLYCSIDSMFPEIQAQTMRCLLTMCV